MKSLSNRSYPSYLHLKKSGKLDLIAEELYDSMSNCMLCAQRCGVNRHEGELGVCRTGIEVSISSVGPHYGEESVLVGHYGSGTIFFSGCNLKCIFCQNFTISQQREGHVVKVDELSKQMLFIQKLKCHNLNLVTPTHVLPMILKALSKAAADGLSLPIVYNCGGYESKDIIRKIDGIIDIYMPDFKYGSNATSRLFSHAENYFTHALSAIKEMHRQVGSLTFDEDGIALRGLLIRHLVLPENLADSKNVIESIALEISPDSYVNIMDQFRPCYKAFSEPGLSRPITRIEYDDVVKAAISFGIRTGE
jgi:putative pyruvate formate lyase activating enzyme